MEIHYDEMAPFSMARIHELFYKESIAQFCGYPPFQVLLRAHYSIDIKGCLFYTFISKKEVLINRSPVSEIESIQ
jgi:hypothetical protein